MSGEWVHESGTRCMKGRGRRWGQRGSQGSDDKSPAKFEFERLGYGLCFKP